VIRAFVRRSANVTYLTSDQALELDGVRDGPATWSPLGDGRSNDPTAVLRSRGRAVVGYDLVVAAPRAVSCLVAVGTLDEQRATVAAHRTAVREAVAYLERRAVVVRRTILGDVDQLAGTWPGATGFTHGVNRVGEPHLHDHVLVPAATREWPQQLDAHALYGHFAAADALYRASLRNGVHRDTGREVWRTFRGVEYVEGIDEGVRALWPGRANDRDAKVLWQREEIVRRWRRDLTHYVEGPSVPVPTRSRRQLHEHSFAAALEGRHVIRRHDLVAAWADAATFGARAESVEHSISRWYPELDGERGSGTVALSRDRARMNDVVREHGARSLDVTRDAHDRSLDRSRDRSSRGVAR
jgi:hypothetical protein